MADDPVHERDGKWWFWDETWSVEFGPFGTKAEADGALDDYCLTYLGKMMKEGE